VACDSIASRYVGTRREGTDYNRGANPKGMLYYGPRGEMAVQIAPDVERTRAGAEMTAEEALIAVNGYIACLAPTRSMNRRAL
jgi:phosphopantothenate synthetase